jgi:hypothetical protein
MNMKRILAPALLAATLFLSGCISLRPYVDPTLGDVPAAEHVSVANPQPVQLVFDFQSKGASNPRAMAFLTEEVTERVRASGLFSEVSTAPAPNGAILAITINNIPEADAAGRGFAAGLTFGLAGQTVTDYYVGTVHYAAGPGAPAFTAEEHHAIHSLVGAGSGPPGMVASPNLEAAVRQMTQQLVDHLLNDVARDPTFTAAHTSLNTWRDAFTAQRAEG